MCALGLKCFESCLKIFGISPKKIKLSDYTVSTRKIEKTALVFRVMMYDHIPMDENRKKNPN